MGFSIIALVILVALIGVYVWQSTQSGSGTVNRVVQRINPSQYQTSYVQTGEPHVLVDVRTPQEFASGHIPGAVNISLQELPSQLDSLPKDQPIVLYCRSGARSNTAAQIMARAGFTEIYDLGGIISWQAQGNQLQSAVPVR